MVYRYQVTNVGYWRGQVKRWNTTHHYNGDTNTDALHNIYQKTCYPAPGDVVGACSGGVASITMYAGTGGAPISRTIYFDWATPTTWIPYTGTVWAGIPEGTPPDASGESALVMVGNMSGLSTTGKPVTTRKYIHAIPSRTATSYLDPDVNDNTVTNLLALWGTQELENPAGVQPLTISVERYYLNHQRVRGRRRPTSQVAAQSFSAGVVVGAGTSASGGGAPAQFQ